MLLAESFWGNIVSVLVGGFDFELIVPPAISVLIILPVESIHRWAIVFIPIPITKSVRIADIFFFFFF